MAHEVPCCALGDDRSEAGRNECKRCQLHFVLAAAGVCKHAQAQDACCRRRAHSVAGGRAGANLERRHRLMQRGAAPVVAIDDQYSALTAAGAADFGEAHVLVRLQER